MEQRQQKTEKQSYREGVKADAEQLPQDALEAAYTDPESSTAQQLEKLADEFLRGRKKQRYASRIRKATGLPKTADAADGVIRVRQQRHLPPKGARGQEAAILNNIDSDED